MRSRRRSTNVSPEHVYEIRTTPRNWRLVRTHGGYARDFDSREAALAAGFDICRQLAPARLLVRDEHGAIVQERVFAQPARRLRPATGATTTAATRAQT